MPLTFLFDENRRGPVWQAVRSYNRSRRLPIDALRVGDPGGPPFGTPDPALVRWAAAYGRILVSIDRQTLVADFVSHLAAGNPSPGLFIIRPRTFIPALIDFLEFAAHAGEPADFADRVTFVP